MTIYNLYSWLQLKLSLRDAYRYILCRDKHQWYKTTTKFKSILSNNNGTYEIDKMPCIKCKRCGQVTIMDATKANRICLEMWKTISEKTEQDYKDIYEIYNKQEFDLYMPLPMFFKRTFYPKSKGFISACPLCEIYFNKLKCCDGCKLDITPSIPNSRYGCENTPFENWRIALRNNDWSQACIEAKNFYEYLKTILV